MDHDVSGVAEVFPRIGFEFLPYSGIESVAGYYWKKVPEAGVHCPECYSLLDWETVSSQVVIKARKDVVSASGRAIVTPRFREFCIANGYHDIAFHRVGIRRELYEMRPTRVLEIDWERSQPLLAEFCRRCGNFECYLVGRSLFFDGVTGPLDDGFYRTNMIWGCRSGKHPIIVVAETTMLKIKLGKFTGVTFRPVPSVDSEFEARKAIVKASRLSTGARRND